MMRIFAVSAMLVSAIALAACQPAVAPGGAPDAVGQGAPAEEGRVAVEPIVSAAELAGQYRLAGLNAQEVDVPYGIAVAITAGEIGVVENCLNLRWKYHFAGQRLVTERIAGPSCRRAVLPEEQALIDALTGADKVGRTPANGILFDGGGGTAVLFPQ